MRDPGLEAYVEAIEGHLRARRGVDHILSPRDFALARAWHEAGVPLATVLVGIDRAFEASPQVTSLSYCRRRVEELAASGPGPARRPAPPAEGGPQGDDLVGLCRLRGLFLHESSEKVFIRCPWAAEHTHGDGEKDAALLLKDGKVVDPFTGGGQTGTCAREAGGSGMWEPGVVLAAKLRERLEGTGVSVTRHGENIILNMPSNITFATDESDIRPAFYEVLNSVAIVLREFNQTLVDVNGHTDSDGSDEYNQELSDRRANSVAQYLVSQQLDPQRFSVQGLGETQPIATNASVSGKSQNRRVEIQLVPLT